VAALHVSLGGRHSAHRVEEAEDTVNELRSALEDAGTAVPSLLIDPAGLAREAPCPLVEAGGGRSAGAAARRAAAPGIRRAPEAG
jgi:hypothetical protein